VPAGPGDRQRRRAPAGRAGRRRFPPWLLSLRSAPDSVRARHIRARPSVSATHLPGEELAVTVHGRALPVDIRAEEGTELRRALLDVYVPRYGSEWEQFLDYGPVHWRIEPERMFSFHMPG
jgi:hypothetical protein